MVASHGLPGICVVVPSARIRAALLDWAVPTPAPALDPPPGLCWELLPKALSSCAVTCWRSRGIESVTPITRIRAVAVASTGRIHMPGVRST
jgi:hypothetical protein